MSADIDRKDEPDSRIQVPKPAAPGHLPPSPASAARTINVPLPQPAAAAPPPAPLPSPQQSQSAFTPPRRQPPAPEPWPVPIRRPKDAFTADFQRRRRLTEYEKSLRRDPNELEDENFFEAENDSLIQRQITGRKKKAALPARERKDKRIIFKGTWRRRYGIHDRTKARLQKYRVGLIDIIRSAARAFSGKRGGNKQS